MPSSNIMMISNNKCLLTFTLLQLVLTLVGVAQGQTGDGSQAVENQIQCFACGLPKVHPENDIVGSYGKKIYNHSCDEFDKYIRRGKGNTDFEEKFIRTCPVGVKSCFGAKGSYDKDDKKELNDIKVQFLGCSEAKHKHDYGCDEEEWPLNVPNKNKDNVMINIDVTLCFCSKHLCNHLEGEMFSGAMATNYHNSCLHAAAIMTLLWKTVSSRVTTFF